MPIAKSFDRGHPAQTAQADQYRYFMQSHTILFLVMGHKHTDEDRESVSASETVY